MRSLLLRLWTLPWPAPLRRAAQEVVTLPWLQGLVFPQFLVGVVGVVENDAGEVLLLRHTYRPTYPWGLPTGYLEHGEQPADALRREIREETGFSVDLLPGSEVYAETDRPLVNIVYRGRYRAGSFAPNAEISAARFFPRSELPAILPGQRLVVEASRAWSAAGE